VRREAEAEAEAERSGSERSGAERNKCETDSLRAKPLPKNMRFCRFAQSCGYQ